MIIHKFGGTSVKDADRFAKVAEIIISHQRQGDHFPAGSQALGLKGCVVVVSAMSGVTDQLIAGGRAAAESQDKVYREIKARLLERHLEVIDNLIRNPERLEVAGLIEDRLHDLERLYRSIAVLGEFTVRGSDAVTSLGEQLSAHILAAALRERGERAQAISATELIVTDERFGEATPLKAPTNQRLEERLLPLIARGVIPVITGYVAATERGVSTTLGRGGSDYSAAIIGAGLGAEEVWIWSDVDGILTADPNLTPEARTLAELSYAEAAELAYYGADVLHPKTIRPVIEAGIPLRILNSYNPSHPGTLIVQQPGAQRELWPAIISTTGLSLVALGTSDDRVGADHRWTQREAARALQILSEAGIEVPLFAQSFSEHRLNLVVRESSLAHCLNVLRREFGGEPSWQQTGSPERGHKTERMGTSDGTYNLAVKEKVATVSVVGFLGGAGLREDQPDLGVVARAFTALGKHGTRVIAVAQAGTENSVSFCIPAEQIESTVRSLHHELGPEVNNG
jgi:aspartate kinase